MSNNKKQVFGAKFEETSVDEINAITEVLQKKKEDREDFVNALSTGGKKEVSSTFDKLMQEAEEEIAQAEKEHNEIIKEEEKLKEVEVAQGKDKVELLNKRNDLRDSIVVDLNNIKISDRKINIKTLKSGLIQRPAMQVVACQSGYSAFMSALSGDELHNLLDSETDNYTYKKMLYMLVANHMEDSSVGKMDFLTFEKVTSLLDFETLLYGIYCKTFPKENNYTVNCSNPDCGKQYKTTINNNTLLETRGKGEVFERIADVINEVRTPDKLHEVSIVNTTTRALLPDSKFILDIKIPTLYENLEETISPASEAMMQKHSTLLGYSLFIKTLYIPNIIKLEETGELEYSAITNKMEMVELLTTISYEDTMYIGKEINKFSDKYMVSYSLKEMVCPHCATTQKDIPLSIENILFTVARQKEREANEENND